VASSYRHQVVPEWSHKQQEYLSMSKQIAVAVVTVLGIAVIGTQMGTRVAAQSVGAAASTVVPTVFQAAGPNVASIQGTIDAFRAALGGINNGSVPGPLAGGRREINWDGGGSTATSLVPTPFDGFLVSRGARFVTPGSGFVQAPVEGLAQTFDDPSFATIFRPFSPVRLFSAIDSNRTEALFFVPGGGQLPATTKGFGAIFSDVDTQLPEKASTNLSFIDAYGKVLYTVVAPASPGDASFSFVGVLFDDAQIARVEIEAGQAIPGTHKHAKRDVVMMDDFIYGEPQMIIDASALQTLNEALENLR
jgi:hypothetical protein